MVTDNKKRAINFHRNEDERIADLVSEFLEKHFYLKETENYKRITDKETQVLGIDTVFSFNGKDYMCDEKAAVRFINKPLKTFALELSFINRKNEVVDGWFINIDKMKNNSYLFVWLDGATNTSPKTIDDITSLTFALVLKEDIFKYLKSLGWTVPKLKRKAQRIRYEGDRAFGDFNRDGVAFCFSNKCFFGTNKKILPEEPINILLPRSIYKKIAICYKEYKK